MSNDTLNQNSPPDDVREEPKEDNTVEQATELELINPEETLERLARYRQYLREQWKIKNGHLGLEDEVANKEDNGKNDINPDKETININKSERDALIKQVHNQFHVIGEKYHFKDRDNQLAFKDTGTKLVTKSNDERIAKGMALLAKSKGWQTIKVSGHKQFKQQVWLEANLCGLGVRGYKPTEQDLQYLEDLIGNRMQNTIEKSSDFERKTENQRNIENSEREIQRKDNFTTNINSAKKYQEDNKDKNKPIKSKSTIGIILEHGAANYNNDPNEKQSYFVKLATESGEKTIWGIDLERAIAESDIKKGDAVKIEFKGKRQVTVEAVKRDDKGQIIGTEQIRTHRNTWDVEKSDKHKIIEAIASTYIDANVKDVNQRDTLMAAIDARLNEKAKSNTIPDVNIYDKQAPAKENDLAQAHHYSDINTERTR